MTRSTLTLVVIAAAAFIAGCGGKAGEIFPALPQPLVWPAPPETPRIRYVGHLSRQADLKAGKNLGQQIGAALFGRAPEPAMLSPYAVCTDAAGRLFVADSNGQTVHVIDLARRRWTQLRPATKTKLFEQPVGIACDPTGGAFVADSAAGRVYVFDAAGKPAGTIGADFLQRPCGLAFDARQQRLLVVDAAAHQLVVLSRDGRLIERVGGRGTDPGQFNYPTNVAIAPSGHVYISDSLNFRVQELDEAYRPIRTFGKKGDLPGYFSQPKGLAVDPAGRIYVVDANFESVQIFDPQGQLLLFFGEEGRAPGEFWLPAGIWIDGNGRIWVADSYNKRVQVFDLLPEPPGAPQP